MKAICDGVERFRSEVFPGCRSHFEELGKGQSPRALLVTCSDSRIDPAMITQTQPGEIFVIRNAGNMVPPQTAGPGGESATIEYGIEALKIPNIIVCGHTHCGAMGAVRDPASASALPTVSAWIEHAGDCLDRVDQIQGFDDALTQVVAANVMSQLEHLRTLPSVAGALERGDVTLHGWVYDFEGGTIYVGDAEGRFAPLSEVDATEGVANLEATG